MMYFRASPAVYASICNALDAEYGYPNIATRTERALPLQADLPSDSSGRVYLAVPQEHVSYQLPSELLPPLLASGAVEEVTQADYEALLPQPQPIPLPTPIPEGDTFPVSPSNPRFGQ